MDLNHLFKTEKFDEKSKFMTQYKTKIVHFISAGAHNICAQFTRRI